MIRISVAIATFNGENYIAEQLNSILNQTMLPAEIIIGDDGSNDNTIDVIKKFYQTTDIPILLTRNLSRLGFKANFEATLQRCTGDIIFLADQDDYWYSNKIETLTNLLSENESSWLAIHDGDLADGTLVKSGITKFDQIRHIYGRRSKPKTGALTAIKKNALSLILPSSVHYTSHDQWLHDFAGQIPGKVLIIERSLQLIRRHQSNTSSTPISSLRKESRLKFLLNHMVVRTKNPALDSLSLNEFIVRRLLTINQQLKEELYLSTSQIQITVTNCKKKINFIRMRKKLQSLYFPLRQIKAFSLLLRGGYSQDMFPWNFIKDFLLS